MFLTVVVSPIFWTFAIRAGFLIVMDNHLRFGVIRIAGVAVGKTV
jgi:hypothetical protein